jgi:acylphosphatase
VVTPSTTRRIAFVVTGRVQGVAFRAHAQREAERLAVTGFVRNRTDGAVEGEAEGSDAALAAFERWLAEGPPWARVDRVATSALPVRRRERGFGVHR